MGSISASGIPVVHKQQLNIYSLGGKIAIASGVAAHSPEFSKLDNVAHVPEWARSLADFGTQPTGVDQATMHGLDMVKRTNSERDAEIDTILGGIPASGEVAAEKRTSVHTGNKVVVNDVSAESIVGRKDNTSERPGG